MTKHNTTNILNTILLFCNCLLGIATLAVCYSHLFTSTYLYLLSPTIIPLLVANIVFGLIWLIKKPKFSILTVLVLLLCFHIFPYYFQINKNAEINKEHKTVCIQTYNVHYFKDNSSLNTSDAVLHLAEKNNVDILCIQEHANREDYREYKQNYEYNTSKDEGVVIYSKYPIIHSENVHFAGSSQSGVIADITIENKTVRVISVHLQTTGLSSSWRIIEEIRGHGFLTHDQGEAIGKLRNVLTTNTAKRNSQISHICEIIKESPYPVILCGDLNDVPLSKTYSQITNILSDAFKNVGHGFGLSYGALFPCVRIDYIFHSDSIKPINLKYQKSALSDHQPVFFKFHL